MTNEVEETARGGHKNIDSALDLFPLRSVPDPTVDQSDAKPRMLGKLLQSFRNLVGQFAGGFQNQGAEFSRFVEVLKDGEGKSGCFSSACLGRADDVFSR